MCHISRVILLMAEIRQTHQLSLVVYPIIYIIYLGFSTIPGGFPDFSHQQYGKKHGGKTSRLLQVGRFEASHRGAIYFFTQSCVATGNVKLFRTYTSWKINGWNLKITCLKRENHLFLEPNLHDFGFHVKFQGCIIY